MQESLAQSATFTEERRVAFFKKALEASTHVARKMLTYKGVLCGDSKGEVQAQYSEIMPHVLSGQFDYLLEVDSSYSWELGFQVDKPNQDTYTKTLTRLQHEMPRVLEFLRSNILRLNAIRT